MDLILKVNAGAYSFEAANPRHEHEYHVWETVKLPEGKVIIPGVITHASNIVEHPELIAERITRFAKLVGRENVIAGSDCGFSSQATYNPEVHPTVVWAKFQAMAEGARLATKQLWRINGYELCTTNSGHKLMRAIRSKGRASQAVAPSVVIVLRIFAAD